MLFQNPQQGLLYNDLASTSGRGIVSDARADSSTNSFQAFNSSRDHGTSLVLESLPEEMLAAYTRLDLKELLAESTELTWRNE